MKKLICLTLLLGFVMLAVAQKSQQASPAPGGKSALQSMVDTELAFARMAKEQGIRPAFMAFIADDGILFRPTAVKGKQWMIEHPLPPTDKRPVLSWYPTFAHITFQGNLGYTTGPWEYKADIHDAAPVAWGNFLTVWRRQPDGSWKFAIDLGISNPKPEQAATPWQLPDKYHEGYGNVGGVGPAPDPRKDAEVSKKEAAALLAREREFSAASVSRGTQQAFAEYAALEVRMFRNGQQPILGKANAVAAILEGSIVWTWEPAFADVSRSHDLGYTYGTYKITSRDPTSNAEKVETGNYYRIWEKRSDNITQPVAWRVVADLLDPLPESKN